MKHFLCVLVSVVGFASSASIQKRDAWPSPIREYFQAVKSEIRSLPASSLPPKCDFSSASLPTTSSSPLPPPSPGLKVYHVAVGRGTQVCQSSVMVYGHHTDFYKNYTCSSPSAPPTPIGAVAGLYNASCLAGNFPSVLATIPGAALSIPAPSGNSALFPANLQLSGRHYFYDATTPTFNLHTTLTNYGIYYAKRVANTTAPAGSPKGPDGAAAVPWLKLAVETPPVPTSAEDTAGNVKEIYRVNTAGGSAPATCQGRPASFQVQYAAEYWFFA